MKTIASPGFLACSAFVGFVYTLLRVADSLGHHFAWLPL